eukprot:COSAG03_NODE_13878_length_485_cov_0.878238_1_plen_119_part_01
MLVRHADSLRSGARDMEPVIRGIFRARGTAAIELLGIGSYDDMQWWSLAYGALRIALVCLHLRCPCTQFTDQAIMLLTLRACCVNGHCSKRRGAAARQGDGYVRCANLRPRVGESIFQL